MTSTATSTTTATDRLDIAALLARHHYALDHDDAALAASTITTDARLATLASLAPATTREHVLRNVLIEVDGDRAVVVGELGLVELELRADGGAVRRQRDATSVDTVIRTPEGWRLAERILHLADIEETEVTVPAERRALIEQGASLLTEPAFLGDAGGGSGVPSELLDIEAALALAAFERDQATEALSRRHLVSNVKVEVDGDRARAESEFVRTTVSDVRRRESGVEITELERSEQDWTITGRTEFVKSDAAAPVGFDEVVRDAIATGTAARRALQPPRPLPLGPVDDARVEIRELLIRYSSAFDQERWQLVDEVFTADVIFGVDAVGYGDGGAASFVEQAQALYHDRLTGLHSIAEPVLRIDGARAWAYTDFTTIAIHESAEPEQLDRLRSGGFYVDELRRTEAGWRVARRVVAFSSSVRDSIAGGADLRAAIDRTRAALNGVRV